MICKFCGKECKNLNSLRQHEIRCKHNPNRIEIKTHHNGFGWKTGRRIGGPTKGKIMVNKDNIAKYIFPDEVDNYLSSGWTLGATDYIKQQLVGKSTGLARTSEAETERRRKISETMKNNPLAGGYRYGSGRGHKGKFNGIYCDSSWELAFLVYCFEHNISVKRCEERRQYVYKNKLRTYIPDFLINDTIIEIKGFSTEQWQAKVNYNPDIKVLYKNDILPLVHYCEEKYGKNFWEVLYDK